MVRTLLNALIGIVLMQGSSCCTEKDCDDADWISEIKFQGFDTAEVDTVDFITYSAGSGFINAIDSSRLFIYSASIYGLEIYLPNPVDFGKEYKLILSSSGDEYKISGFETKQKICNRALIISTPCDYYTALASYYVNGSKLEGGYAITITK